MNSAISPEKKQQHARHSIFILCIYWFYGLLSHRTCCKHIILEKFLSNRTRARPCSPAVCHRQYCVRCTWMYRARVHFIFGARSHVAVHRFFCAFGDWFQCDALKIQHELSLSWSLCISAVLNCSWRYFLVARCCLIAQGILAFLPKMHMKFNPIQSMFKMLYGVWNIGVTTARFFRPLGFFWSLSSKLKSNTWFYCQHVKHSITFHPHAFDIHSMLKFQFCISSTAVKGMNIYLNFVFLTIKKNAKWSKEQSLILLLYCGLWGIFIKCAILVLNCLLTAVFLLTYSWYICCKVGFSNMCPGAQRHFILILTVHFLWCTVNLHFTFGVLFIVVV